MSYNFDGKVVNQRINFRFNSGTPQPTCEKCCKLIAAPDVSHLAIKDVNQVFTVRHYINTPFYIYETKSGTAVVYCSEYCRNKHNHRFKK